MRLPFLQVRLIFQAKLRDESYVGELIKQAFFLWAVIIRQKYSRKACKSPARYDYFSGGNSGVVFKVLLSV